MAWRWLSCGLVSFGLSDVAFVLGAPVFLAVVLGWLCFGALFGLASWGERVRG